MPGKSEGAGEVGKSHSLALGCFFLGLVILGGIFAGAFFYAYLYRKPWVTPVRGVVLTPKRTPMPQDRVDPESACGYYLQAIDRFTVSMTTEDSNVLSQAAMKLARFPWPKPGAVLPPGPPPPRPRPAVSPSGVPMPPPGPGPARSAVRQKTPWNAAEVKKVRAALAKLPPVIALMRRAVTAPDPRIYSITNFHTLFPDLQRVRALTSALTVSARVNAADGRLNPAIDQLLLGLRFSSLLTRGGCMIQHLVGVAGLTVIMKAQWELARKYRESPVQLRRQIRGLQEVEKARDPMSEVYRYEWTGLDGSEIRDFFSGYKKSNFAFWVMLKVLGTSPRQVHSDLSACYSRLVAAADLPEYSARRKALEQFERSLVGVRKSFWKYQDPGGRLIVLMCMPVMQPFLDKYTGNTATFRALRAFLAVKGWAAVHGHAPSRLDRVVPEWLPRLPHDPFLAGKPLAYIRYSNAEWAVYSVGPNQVDDGALGQFFGCARIFRTPPWLWTGALHKSLAASSGFSPPTGPDAGDIVLPSLDFPDWWSVLAREYKRSGGLMGGGMGLGLGRPRHAGKAAVTQ